MSNLSKQIIEAKAILRSLELLTANGSYIDIKEARKRMIMLGQAIDQVWIELDHYEFRMNGL